MSKHRASMRKGPLADLFRATGESERGHVPEPEQIVLTDVVPEDAVPLSEPQDEDLEPAGRHLAPVPDTSEQNGAGEPPITSAPSAYTPARAASSFLAVIRVIGVGGAGLNAVERMIDADIQGVEFLAVNTDAQQLATSDATVKVQLGAEITRGLGSGSDPDVGRRAAEASGDRLRQILKGSDLVFVAAGEGGGTGTGAAPVVARVARELGALTVGIVTMPFAFEGGRRMSSAEAGLERLRAEVDTLIVVPNDRLLQVLDKSTSMIDAFRVADDVLRQGVQGICDLITRPGVINLDFADVRTVMQESGTALMGIGVATGPTRAADAARYAIDSPLIDHEIKGATGVLLSIAGGNDLGLHEITEAAHVVEQAASEGANVIFGASIDPELAGQVWVTVIATGFDQGPRKGTWRPTGSDEEIELPDFLRR